MIAAPASPRPPVEQRCRFTITGVVQGVGFRPFVHRIATELGLSGFVGNDSAAVFVEVQGPPVAIVEFGDRVKSDAPPLSAISSVCLVDLPANPAADRTFRIVTSRLSSAAAAPIPPDVAVCDDCLAEIFDVDDRRFRYPFTTCTNCGPRYTIVRELPYDRPNTTMAGFPMCARCAAEYHDPADRRFHAQPIACPDCGPSLWFSLRGEWIVEFDAALRAAQQSLAGGSVVALKGIGGYHLACRVDDESAIVSLRSRKMRAAKPFAMLVRDLEVARRYAHIDDEEAAVLRGAARPIVLLKRRHDAPIPDVIAPGSPLLGLMLPYSPIHHLLLAPVPGADAYVPDALVLTSANCSNDPICFTDDDAAQRLPLLADAVLDHDRPIYVPCDDSVVRVVDGRELPIRRSRGYAPLPVDFGSDAPAVLAVGGELKNTFCLTDGRRAYLSGHIGDMGSTATLRAFTRSVEQLCELRRTPTRLAADLHPGYHTRNWAERHVGERPLDLVQHHHAHVASLLAEHGMLGEPIIGVAFDGTGYGCDATVWGGEILNLGRDSHRFTRAGHLTPVPLAGGDAAIRNPWRMALAHLWAAGIEWTADLAPVAAATTAESELLKTQFATGFGCVPTTSMGRLFDAVASLLGVRQRIDYEGQAAVELEVLASRGAVHPTRLPALRFDIGAGGLLDPAPVLCAMVGDLREGMQRSWLAAAFHQAVAAAVAEVVDQVSGPTRLVGLTGGVFQNVLLLRWCRERLQQKGFEVLTHQNVPPNDGGLALGQAAVAMLRALDECAGAEERIR